MRRWRNGLARLVRKDSIVVYQADCVAPALPAAPGLEWMHVGDGTRGDLRAVDQAMRLAGEPPGLVPPRFAQGDQFFAWRRADGAVAAFGWMTRSNRVVASVRLADAAGRGFLYNFHTLPAFRGHGLYPALLRGIRHQLGRERFTHLVVDARTSNAASTKGIQQAGFRPVLRIDHLLLLSRWPCVASQFVMDPLGMTLVARARPA
jgi:ribosomal protein S18 acetylase RimI-like enzyme